MNNNSNVSIHASTVKPDKNDNSLWLDLAADPNGSILKTTDGKLIGGSTPEKETKWNGKTEIIDINHISAWDLWGSMSGISLGDLFLSNTTKKLGVFAMRPANSYPSIFEVALNKNFLYRFKTATIDEVNYYDYYTEENGVLVKTSPNINIKLWHEEAPIEATSQGLMQNIIADGQGFTPVSHPNYSTQPTILPQKFGNQLVYERVIIIPSQTFITEIPNAEYPLIPANAEIISTKGWWKDTNEKSYPLSGNFNMSNVPNVIFFMDKTSEGERFLNNKYSESPSYFQEMTVIIEYTVPNEGEDYYYEGSLTESIVGQTFNGFDFRNHDFSMYNLYGVTFEGCDLSNANFSGSKSVLDGVTNGEVSMFNCNCVGVDFTNCELAIMSTANSNWSGVIFDNSKFRSINIYNQIGGLNLSEAGLIITGL